MADTQIVIDLDKMTIADLATFDDTSNFGPIVDLLDRVVEGGASHRPVTQLQTIVTVLREQIEGMTTAKN